MRLMVFGVIIGAGLVLMISGCQLPLSEWEAGSHDEEGPGVVFRFSPERKAVALTIDDGPDSETTGEILDVLERHGARATFFVIGEKIEGNEDLLGRMQGEGHEIGNHGNADRPSILLSSEDFEEDLRSMHKVLSEYGEVRWFRPGWGPYDRRMVEQASRLGYRTALGDVFPYDVFVPSTGFHERYILKHVKPGSIVIVHDGGGRGRRTAEMLDLVLPQLRDKGYEVVTLSEMAALCGEEESRTGVNTDDL
ncbi:MAG: polysaccharide deacetylase family protein [Verrucomicrobiota bacterium]